MKQKGSSKSVLIVIFFLAVFAIALSTNKKDERTFDTVPQTPIATNTNVTANTTNSNVKYSITDTNEKKISSDVSLGKKNALSKAESYLDYTAFSYSGLVEQLEFEGYSNDEAKYGADNCGADWKEQAALKAQSYLDYSSFSRSGLIEQLEFEGFTSSQAEYGAEAVGY